MRNLLALMLLLAAGAASAETPRKLWVGAGKTDLASEAANWVEGSAPVTGDRVVFGNVSSKDCRWDLDVFLSSFTMSQSYAGHVRLEKVSLRAERNVRVSGGTLDLGEGILTVYWRIYIEKTGKLEIGRGELRLAPAGILIDEGGTLSSTGQSQAKVTAARAGESFSVVVAAGNVNITNPAGTVVDQSKGIVMYSGAKIAKAEGVEMKAVAAGNTAVTMFSKSTEPVTLQGWTFDASVTKKIEAPAGSQESGRIVLTEVGVGGTPRYWTGSGATASASEAANWKDAKLPAQGETAVFSSSGTKDCDWDYSVALAGLRLDAGFEHAVHLGTSSLTLSGDLAVAAGRLDLQESDFRVSGTIELTGGTLELGAAAVRLGRGIRQTGGLMSSAGDSSPILTSIDPSAFYAVALTSGAVQFANAAGTRFDATKGLAVGADETLTGFNRVYITHLAPHTAALTLARSTAVALRFENWDFDESVAVNVDASGLPDGSGLVMADASGPHAGSALSRDPSKSLQWEPDQAVGTGEPLAELMRDKVSVTPVIDFDLVGGQYFFQSQEGSLSGNARVLAAAAIKNPAWPKWTFEPILSSGYRGTKQLADLVGGGTLFQEMQEHRAAFRATYEVSPKWRLKPMASYEVQLMKETRDERWGHGLFDHRRPRIGVEAEYIYRDPFSVRFGYDYYQLQFPHYVSLESQIKGQAGGSLARELAGAHVIDSTNHALSAGIDVETPWRSFASADAGMTLRKFSEQHLVAASGDLQAGTRSDTALSIGVSWRVPRRLSPAWKIAPALGVSIGRNDSNQNSYDAQRVTFLPNYYDTRTTRLSADCPVSRALGGERWLDLSVGAAYERTDYPGRPAQDAAGTYGTSKIHSDSMTTSLRASWPIIPHFRWTASLEAGKQSSNMAYEKLYRYNYSSFAYLMGFSWQY